MENTDWIIIDFNNLPREMWIVEWLHPDLGTIEGHLISYEPSKDTGWIKTYWIAPSDLGADIHISEFTHYRKKLKPVDPTPHKSEETAFPLFETANTGSIQSTNSTKLVTKPSKDLDEIKDHYAQLHGYSGWEGYCKNQKLTDCDVNTIADLYAQSKHSEYKKQITKLNNALFFERRKQFKKQQTEWVKVSDRLPESYGNFLAIGVTGETAIDLLHFDETLVRS